MPKVSPEHFKRRRAEILEAAKRVFTRKGYEPTTMQDVVKESGMSRGGVYQYFSSTEDMFIAIRETDYEQFEGVFEELLKSHGTVWKALMAYLDNYLYEPEGENTSFGLVSYEYSVVAWRNEKHRQVIYDQSRKIASLFVSFLKKGIESDEFSPRLPLEAITFFIFNVTDGLLLHYMIAGRDRKLAYIKEQVEGLKLFLQSALQVNEATK